MVTPVRGVIAVLGLYWADQGYVVPVLRQGLYHHLAGPGYFNIIPALESLLQAIYTRPQAHNYPVENVLTSNGIPLNVTLRVRYMFNPAACCTDRVEEMVGYSSEQMKDIIGDCTDQCLREVIGRYGAEEARAGMMLPLITREVQSRLHRQLLPVGVALLPGRGVTIKQVALPPELAKAGLKAEGLRAIIETLQERASATTGPLIDAEIASAAQTDPRLLTIYAVLDALRRQGGADRPADKRTGGRISV